MKYEMIFGDDGLFFDAQKDCEMVGNGHHKVENGKLMVWNFSEKYWAESHTNKITIAAMRRIIAESKRWTVEDKKAGRLPEVGNHILIEGNLAEFIGLSNAPNNWCFRRLDGEWGIQTANKDWFSPIETPDEKTQREDAARGRCVCASIIKK